MRLLTADQTAKMLNINITALTELVNTGRLPYTKLQAGDGHSLRFNISSIEDWLKKRPAIKMDEKKYLERLKRRIAERYPDQLKTLKEFSDQYSEPRKPKGYNLAKIPNKKLGFVYYVRYIVNGKLVYSRWCTHTNNEDAAIRWAIENRERILRKYFDKKENKKPVSLYPILSTYYSENSPYLQIDAKRGRVLSETARNTYHNFIINTFIPYLKKEEIKDIEQIDTPFLTKFQNYLLTKIKPQTINHYIGYISLIFDHLLITGQVKTNPCKSVVSLKIGKDDQKIIGCYEVNKLKGVFNKRWKNELSYLLSLLIYTTDLRNSEIEKIQLKDIILIDKYRFINIPKSKTINGVRIVPLHDFVYKELMAYARKNNKGNEDYIFKLPKKKKLGSEIYKKAYLELAEYTGYSIEQLQAENITFYSGRHFWKTLMNCENLGDIEEYFMGHKVSGDISKRYNHHDKQGKKKLLDKTKKVFEILDKHIFR